jgi:hypothetical protein
MRSLSKQARPNSTSSRHGAGIYASFNEHGAAIGSRTIDRATRPIGATREAGIAPDQRPRRPPAARFLGGSLSPALAAAPILATASGFAFGSSLAWIGFWHAHSATASMS